MVQYLMKSKRKQINKYKRKNEDQYEQKNEQTQQRTSGNKPFQLNKLRVNRKSNLQQLTDKITQQLKLSSNQEGPTKVNMYIDLVIKKKLLSDNYPTLKLQSQRKNLVFLEDENIEKTDQQMVNYDSQLTQQLNEQKKDILMLPRHQSLQMTSNSKIVRRQKKCQCCQSFKELSHKAIICNGKESQLLQNQVEQKQDWQANITESNKKQQIDLKAELKLITDKIVPPPFSFTNIKWRSKSQILNVDKWKERYSKQDQLKQAEASNRVRHLELVNLFQKKMKERQIKQILMKTRHGKMVHREKIYLPVISRKNSDNQEIKRQNSQKRTNNCDKNYNKTRINFQKERKNSEQLTKQYVSQKMTKKEKGEQQIVIKKMFEQYKSDSFEDENQNQKLEQSQEQIHQKEEKQILNSRNKKEKYLTIQIKPIQSNQSSDDQRKKIKPYISSIFKMQKEQKQKSPTKLNLEKVEQIPERWQYGQSRDYSRIQMGAYIQIQKEEEINKKQYMEQQKLMSQLLVKQDMKYIDLVLDSY